MEGTFWALGALLAIGLEVLPGLEKDLVLAGRERLAASMIRYGVGVQVKRTVQIVEVDEDFFE